MRRHRARVAGALASAFLPLMAGAQTPITQLTDSPAFGTLKGAAVAALAESFRRSSVHEYGGVLLACGTSFRFSEPVTINDSAHVEYRARLPAGCTLAGIYHTHPMPEARSRQFSPDDIQMAGALGVPSFIGVAYDMTVRVLKAEKAPRRTAKDHAPRGVCGVRVANL